MAILIPNLSDTFQRADGVPGTADSKHPWSTSGANISHLVGGMLVNAQPGVAGGGNYTFVDLLVPPSEMSATISLSGAASGTPGVVLISGSSTTNGLESDLQKMLHWQITRTGGTCSYWRGGVNTGTIFSPTWTTPLLTDGTQYNVRMVINRNTVTFYGPDGSVTTVTDSNIADLYGRFLCYQCAGGYLVADARFHRVGAIPLGRQPSA